MVVRILTASETWTPPAGVTAVDVLIVAGGGGGGNHYGGGGGGGAGGVRYVTNVAVSGPVTVTVGAGGIGATDLQMGGDGGSSAFGALTAIGGGGGGAWDGNGRPGGSGGGGSGHGDGQSPRNTGQPGAGTAGQGFAGGTGYASTLGFAQQGAGGGGAGGAAPNAPGDTAGANRGGHGLNYADLFGTTLGVNGWVGGGGGASGSDAGTGSGPGGNGGGGAGFRYTASAPAQPGAVNSGGGGGGGEYDARANGGAGGSGVVALRYSLPLTGDGYFDAVAADSPVWYGKLNDPTATMLDSSGNNRDGTYSTSGAAPTRQVPSLLVSGANKAASFPSGIGSSAIVPYAAWQNPGARQDLSVECIFKQAGQAGTNPTLMARYNGSNWNADNVASWTLRLNGGNNPTFYVFSGSGGITAISSNTNVVVGTTYHIVVTMIAGFIRMYLNGVQVGSGAAGFPYAPSTQPLGVGACNGISSGDTGINGILDEPALYDYGLSAARVTVHYNESVALAPVTGPAYTMYLGNTRVDKLYLGNTQVDKLYLGNTQIT